MKRMQDLLTKNPRENAPVKPEPQHSSHAAPPPPPLPANTTMDDPTLMSEVLAQQEVIEREFEKFKEMARRLQLQKGQKNQQPSTSGNNQSGSKEPKGKTINSVHFSENWFGEGESQTESHTTDLNF